MKRERFSWHAEFTTVPHIFIALARPASLYCEYVYTHVSDCVETVYELPLLPNNSASETCLYQSVLVRSVDWIFIIGAPAWR
jgi:hypothetical protein